MTHSALVGSFTVTSSASPSTSGKFCRGRGPEPSPPSSGIRIASNGRHHGLARTIEVPTRDAAAAPPSGAPRLRLGPLLTVDYAVAAPEPA